MLPSDIVRFRPVTLFHNYYHHIMALTPSVYRIKSDAAGLYLTVQDLDVIARGLYSDNSQKVRDNLS